MSNGDRSVLLRQRLGEVNGEWRMWSKQKERTPERAARMRQPNERRIELVVEIVDLDQRDRSSLVA
jgi:tRNA A37 N6-isopentenylltransferase MiaA